jgi:hypothetical protein
MHAWRRLQDRHVRPPGRQGSPLINKKAWRRLGRGQDGNGRRGRGGGKGGRCKGFGSCKHESARAPRGLARLVNAARSPQRVLAARALIPQGPSNSSRGAQRCEAAARARQARPGTARPPHLVPTGSETSGWRRLARDGGEGRRDAAAPAGKDGVRRHGRARVGGEAGGHGWAGEITAFEARSVRSAARAAAPARRGRHCGALELPARRQASRAGSRARPRGPAEGRRRRARTASSE